MNAATIVETIEKNEAITEARKRVAEEQATGAWQRAKNRGASDREATRCFDECYETWMQE